jgi:hypothetical protein
MSGQNDETAKEGAGFKVSDRRMFTPDGEPIERREADTGLKEESDRVSAERPAPEGSAGEGAKGDEEDEGRSIDFSSFLLSLATSAMAHLGEVPDPASGKTVESLDGARQMIDILSLLREKTRGNLEPEESQLIDSLLYELRMRYLSKTKVINL